VISSSTPGKHYSIKLGNKIPTNFYGKLIFPTASKRKKAKVVTRPNKIPKINTDQYIGLGLTLPLACAHLIIKTTIPTS
jgi:hypothetical protein